MINENMSSMQSDRILPVGKNMMLIAFREGVLIDISRWEAINKPVICYISCAENAKGIANECATLLNQLGVRCVISCDFKQGAEASRKKSFNQADKCLVIMTPGYLQELEKDGSNAYQDFQLIYNGFSKSPENSKIELLLLVGTPPVIPDCPKDRGGIAQLKLLYDWGRGLLSSPLAKSIVSVLARHLIKYLISHLLLGLDGSLYQVLVDFIDQCLQQVLSVINKVFKLIK